jgi:hypothetical protein
MAAASFLGKIWGNIKKYEKIWKILKNMGKYEKI